MSDVERLVDETREFDETIACAVVLKVPESDEYPDGYKVRLHYGTKEDETLLRYLENRRFSTTRRNGSAVSR